MRRSCSLSWSLIEGSMMRIWATLLFLKTLTRCMLCSILCHFPLLKERVWWQLNVCIFAGSLMTYWDHKIMSFKAHRSRLLGYEFGEKNTDLWQACEGRLAVMFLSLSFCLFLSLWKCLLKGEKNPPNFIYENSHLHNSPENNIWEGMLWVSWLTTTIMTLASFGFFLLPRPLIFHFWHHWLWLPKGKVEKDVKYAIQ